MKKWCRPALFNCYQLANWQRVIAKEYQRVKTWVPGVLNIAVPSGNNWVNHPRWHPIFQLRLDNLSPISSQFFPIPESLEFVPPGFSTSTTLGGAVGGNGCFLPMGFKIFKAP